MMNTDEADNNGGIEWQRRQQRQQRQQRTTMVTEKDSKVSLPQKKKKKKKVRVTKNPRLHHQRNTRVVREKFQLWCQNWVTELEINATVAVLLCINRRLQGSNIV